MERFLLPALQFTASQKRLRDDWFGRIETTDKWSEDGPVGEGESQSWRVSNPVDQMAGIAKPGPNKGNEDKHYRAAHEKLAFDLACLVSLPVPPVVLWSDGLGAKYKVGRAISCWAFPQAKKWSEASAQGLLPVALKLTAAADISCMRVFHSWIGDTDRKAEHIIVDLDSPASGLRIAFIDHGNALSHSWKAPDAPLTLCMNYIPDVPEDKAVMLETADHIAGVPDGEIAHVVNRIQPPYLPVADRECILKNLLARKAKLREILVK
ncbi:MAG: hypothetical protein ACLQAR_08950 [Steroidobacteraceae bacterium]